MIRYDFMEGRRIILSNVRADSKLTFLYQFDQFVMWIRPNNDICPWLTFPGQIKVTELSIGNS